GCPCSHFEGRFGSIGNFENEDASCKRLHSKCFLCNLRCHNQTTCGLSLHRTACSRASVTCAGRSIAEPPITLMDSGDNIAACVEGTDRDFCHVCCTCRSRH